MDYLYCHFDCVIFTDNRIVNYVELLRHLDEPLGLVVKGMLCLVSVVTVVCVN